MVSGGCGFLRQLLLCFVECVLGFGFIFAIF